jgi:hypothetical protein
MVPPLQGTVIESRRECNHDPVPAFRGVVSCRIIDGMGAPSIINLSTGDFPATPAGDADIEASLALPDRCFAPIIFVTNSVGRWFAVTGY